MNRSGDENFDLDLFLKMLPKLGNMELLAISAAFQAEDPDSHDDAKAVANDAVRALGLEDELERLHGAIAQWTGAGISRGGGGSLTPEGLVKPMLADLRAQAMPALLDAATVFLLGDSVALDAREVLLAPLWRVVPDR